MKTLVTGATGTVGSQVIRELLARNSQVRVLTRDKSKAPAGVEVVVGDLADPMTLAPAFEGVDALFLLTANGITETHEGMMAVLAARAAKVKRIVLMTIHYLDRDPLIPHFASKMPIEAAVKASGISWTILRPSNFFQNDSWFKDGIIQYGVYPQPLGDKGVSRVDVRDIAEAAAIAITTPGHDGQVYNLVGPKPWTGAATAAAWSTALGKAVKYAGNDLEAWAKASLQWLPGWMVYDFKIMYQSFQDHGLLATPEDIARLTQLLGHAPRGFEDYVKESAAAWSVAAKV